MRYKNIANKRFGSLIAISYHHTHKGQAYWLYKCDCGKEHIARSNTITYITKKSSKIDIPSCGCKELAYKTKHGFRKAKNTHPLYRAYRSIMNRCYNPKDKNYKFYGGRNVTICDEWKNNPSLFIKWGLANGWRKGLSINKDIMCEKLNINPQIYSPQTCIFIPISSNTSFSRGRSRVGINSRLILSWDKCKEIYEKSLNHTYPSQNQFNIAMCKEYGVNSPSAITKAIKSYIHTYISPNETNEH